MDPIAAACAMQWNVELDAGLRSQKPGSQYEAILKLGARLQQWSKEPPVSSVTANLFKLNPGQEQAFANAIMMHLTEAFVSGNNYSRFCILKVLLLEKKSRQNRHKMKGGKGLLTKERMPNYLEVLKRIKLVTRSGDHFARALAFWVIGCLAELAVDSSDICRLILEALHSHYEHEVQAALFASSCFCNISENFSVLALGHIRDLIVAKETTSKTRIQAICVFPEMHSSVLAAIKAHETAKALMVSMSEEDLLATIEALSRLALRCGVLVAAQVDLLLSHICSDACTVVRATSLNCLIKLAQRAAGRTGMENTAVETLASIYDSDIQPPIVKELALHALRKLFPFCVLVSDADHLIRLFFLIKSRAACPLWSQAQPVLGFLVDIVCTLGKLRPDLLKIEDAQSAIEPMLQAVISGKNEEPIHWPDLYSHGLYSHAVLLVCNQIMLLGCRCDIEGFVSGEARALCKGEEALGINELKTRCLFLCGLLMQLAQHTAPCGFVVVDCLSKMVEAILTSIQRMDKEDMLQAASAARSRVLRMLCLCIRVSGLFWLSVEGLSSTAFVRTTKLVTWITSSSISHHLLMDLFALLVKVRVYTSPREAKAITEKVNLAVASFINEKDCWSAYKAVMAAACHGIWENSSMVIEQFIHKTQSEKTLYWLKALAAFCRFEANLQSKCSLKAIQIGTCMAGSESNSEMTFGPSISRVLAGAHVAEDALAAAIKGEKTFEFQRRLLSFRVTFIRTSGALLGLLAPICELIKPSEVEAVFSLKSPLRADSVKLLTSSIQSSAGKSARLCKQFRDLAVAFDVLRVSTMGIDKDSTNILSFTSLGCSFFSFCALFSLFMPRLIARRSELSPSLLSLAASVANDLYLRLNIASGQECPELLNFVLQLGGANGSPLIFKGDSCAFVLKEACTFISCIVQKMLHLQETTSIKNNPEMSWVVLARGIHVCRDSVERWLHLPWALPRHFLCTRAPVAMDVFVETIPDESPGKMKQIAEGHLAPLSMCFQLRNLQVNGCLNVRRLCCALLLKSAKAEREEFLAGWSLGCSSGNTVCAESGLSLVDQLMKEVSFSKQYMWENHDGQVRHERASQGFPPIVVCDVNENGQGFASCLYNTTGLQVGIYYFSVLAVCLDKDGCCWIVPPLKDGPVVRITPL